MTNKFEFKNNDLQLDIAGNIFELDTTDPELVKRVLDFSKDAQEKAKELDGKEDYVAALEESIQFCVDSIDSILGEGASNKIFKDRKVSLFDALDVINYIVSEVNANREEKFNAYSPNRAQRRAKK